GCDVTLNSDDPPHFHTSLKNEYMLAKDQFGYNDEALLGFTKNAIKAAFVDEATRAQLLAKLEAQFDRLK
ncbi:MAG: adenosine deaminase, partial [Nitratireductor sp.]